jgi:ankyrin repeat protein
MGKASLWTIAAVCILFLLMCTADICCFISDASHSWTPLHEAVRGGHIEVVKYLLEQGADKDACTGVNGDGGTPLWWAKQTHGTDHEVITHLMDMGAIEMGPDL